MKRRNIIVVVMIFAYSIYACDLTFGRTNTSIFNGRSSKNEKIDSLKTVVDSLQKLLSQRDATAKRSKRRIDSLQDRIKQVSLLASVRASRERDSLLSLISRREQEVEELSALIGYADTSNLRYILLLLKQPFSSKNMERAVRCFDRIHSSEIKKDYANLRILLINYEKWYGEFLSILEQAQADSDRTNPYADEHYMEEYQRLIAEMDYNKKGFFRNKSWYIGYLDDRIEEAINMLDMHKTGQKEHVADFGSLIERLRGLTSSD